MPVATSVSPDEKINTGITHMTVKAWSEKDTISIETESPFSRRASFFNIIVLY